MPKAEDGVAVADKFVALAMELNTLRIAALNGFDPDWSNHTRLVREAKALLKSVDIASDPTQDPPESSQAPAVDAGLVVFEAPTEQPPDPEPVPEAEVAIISD